MALTRPRYSQIPDTDWKQSVRAATTADVGNVILALMPSTVDGVALNFYDRVLLKSQANAAQNGIYYVKAVGTGANGIRERTKDASSGGALGAVTPSIVTQVEEGTINKNRTFKLTTTGNIDLGTTDLSFVVQAAEPAGATGQLQFANVNNVIGGATTTSYDYVTGNLVLTGNVNTTLLYQNGKRVPQVFTSATPPATPAVGDQWYQVGTDILYEWLQDGTSNYWIDVSGATIANINPITGENIGTLVVNGGNDSTSTSTGALQVVGGVGITGNLNVGGSVSFGGGQLGSDLVISSNTTSISNTTGAIRIASPGGLGVGGNIWAGGAIVANSRIPSTSITTGALVVPGTGGVGIGGNLNVGGIITGGGVRQSISSGAPASPTVGDQWYQLGTDILYQYVSDGTGSYWVDMAGATVANISQQTNTVNDIHLVSGTPSTSSDTGALIVSGGVGIQGNLNLQGGFNISGGNLIANQNITSTNTLTGAIVVTGQGGLGVGGNINAGGNLIVAQAASFLQNVIISANLVAGGTYFAAGGLSVTNGNVVASGTNAQIGGLTITSGAISGLSNLGVTGNITLGGALVATGDISTTGNITGGGLRKYAQAGVPANPVVGDVWYKTDTDVFYQYVNDGTNKYWIDFTSATVANISPQTNQTLSDIVIVSGTPATNTTSGALQVQGGAGITGNVFTGNLSTATVSATNFTYANGVSILEGNQGTYSNANVTAYLAASNISVGGSISAGGNLTASGTYFSAGGLSVTAGNIVASGARAVIGGLTIENGGISSLASLNVIGSGTLGGDFAVTGNITGGGLRKYAQAGVPVNPIVGDVWYKTDTDVFYQYVNDGTNKYWIDYTSATVSNANPTSPQSLQDLQIVSGTPSTGSGTGALQVTGGAAVTGNVFTGNLSTATVAAGNFTFANGVSILLGNEGTYSNANVTAYLTARNVTIADGNITATGGYLAAGGFIATAGNIRTTSANIGGVIIESGGIGQLASLGVVGAATIGADLAVTGNITGGGLRKYAQSGVPANPIVGDVWYKTDTDVYYQYINDGTNKYWVDFAGATVSNASITSSQIAYDIVVTTDTPSTSTTTGAVRVQGGIGLIGNIFTTGIADFGGNLTAGNIKANNNLQTNTLAVVQNATVGGTLNVTGAVSTGNLTTGNITGYGFATNAGNITGYGFATNAGNLTATGQYFSAGGLSVTAGNITATGFSTTGGNVIATGSYAQIGGLTIQNGGFGSLASLGVTGAATFGANVDITGRVTGGGIRKTSSTTAPASPIIGDTWYKTDTDTLYQYINDGTSNYWIDISGATVANISPQTNQTLNDIVIVSGTPATNTTSGALQVQGGAGITGNVFTGNLSTTTVSATAFTFANGVSILLGNEGTYSNANVISYLTAKTVAVSDAGNITSSGTYFNTAGLTVVNGNVTATGTTATIGGLVINNGSLPSLPTLGVVGAATIGGDIAVTGNITAGGLRKYAQAGAPANPVVGDVWYKTDTDVFYQYVNDGTNKYWIDYTSATVSNANPTSPQSLQDLQIVSGTASTSTTSGALQVTGGAGISGNIFVGGNATIGNLSTTTIAAGGFTYANGVSILVGNEGTYSNSNVTAYLTARTTTITDGFLSTAGITVTAGNLRTASANIGGVIIESGGIGSLASLNVIGGATIGGDVAITGNITGGGIRKTSSASAPATPTVGDQWYKTDTDTLYQYINDGTSKYWIDVAGATVSNASITSSQIAYDIVVTTDTPSTSTTTGAVRVQGGIGLIGNIFTTGIANFGGNLTAGNITANNNVQTNTLQVVGDTNVNKLTAVGNITSTGTYFSAGGISVTNGNIVASGARAVVGGLTIENGGFGSIASLDVIGLATFSANVNITENINVTKDITASGNIMGGGLRKYAQTTKPTNAVVGDVWYKTDTDVYYTYVNDGTNKYWIDYASATVSNASPTSLQSIQDLAVVGGTASTNTTTGAIVVAGGVGVTGNINAGNISATNVSAGLFTYANGVSILAGNEGTYSNANVISYLTGQGITTPAGNLISSGTYFSAGGLSVTNGNVVATGTTATIGGLVITNGALPSLPSLGVTGSATIGADLAVTGNITGGGVRKSQSTTAPANPVVGDLWYKTDTDVYYQYTSDGTNKYWIDYVGATVSNAAVSASTNNDYRVASGTASIDTDTGALTVVGGVGITGNVNAGNVIATSFRSDNFSFANGRTLADRITGTFSNANVAAYLTTGTVTASNITVTGTLTAPGIRKTSSTSAPASPAVGDLWYKTDTDVYYQYINDGTNNYWVDYVGATVSNAAVTAGAATDYAFTSGTPSTSISTGAVVVSGGVGISGALYIGGLGDFGGNVTVNNLRANLNIQSSTLAVTGSGAVVGNLTTGNLATGIATIARADIAGALTVGGDVNITGNIVAGGVRKSQSTTAPVNPTVGDLWYKTDTDVYYQYTSDGTNKYWIDYVGATVSNAAVQNSSSVDFTITSGTESTNTTSGALTIVGGVGITGNINAGNVIATSFRSDNFLFANGRTLADRITGTYSNSNVTAYLTGSITTGDLSTGNITAGNISTTDITARDVTLTGNITGGGLRKYAQSSAPANPILGDVWYKTDTDVYYQYINDGANYFWVDYVGPTVSNAAVQNGTNSDFAIASGTLSTSPVTGALVVTGGVGVTGNIYTTGLADFGGNLRASNVTANNNTQTNTLAVVQNATVGGTLNVTGAVSTGNLTAGNITGYGFTTNAGNLTATGAYLSAGGISATSGVLSVGNIISSGTRAVVGGLTIENGAFGNITSLGVLGAATIGGDVAITGNITAGGLRKYAQTSAPAVPVVGDVWYKTDTDVYYQYINDGTNKYWIDYSSATVSNASPTSPQSLQDLQIVSGTASTSTTSGALQVTGGAGISGNVTAGNVVTAQVSADKFTYANGISILTGNEGTYSNANVTAYLTARSVTIADGNITATGGYLAAGGFVATAGNIRTTSANIGGLIIENSGISSLASLGVIGAATIGGDVAITGNITAGGLRKYAQDSTPANPIVGDVWYKTDTDVFYQYVNDGTNKYWVDYVGATVSNASITSSQIAYDIVVTTDTPSTSTTTGAIRVQGGIGLIGNIFTTGIANFGGNLTAGNVTANNNLQTNTLAVINNATVGGTLNVTSALSSASLSTGNVTVGNITGYGFTTNAGNLIATGAYFAAGGMSSTAGNITGAGFNITGGNIVTTGARAVVGGLEIINGSFANLASLGVVGSATIGADLAVTGNITGGGLRKTQGTTPPANPVQGDVWYKTDTDVYYQYINDGTASYWIDYVSATVANITQNAATVSDLQIVSGTPSTSTSTGALTVAGGIGVTGNVNISSNVNVGNVNASTVYTPTVRATSYTYPNGASILDGYYFGTYSNANVSGYLTAQGIGTTGGNLTATGSYFSAGGITATAGQIATNGNIVSQGIYAKVGGLEIINGGFGSLASIGVIGSATIGGDVAITGNITAGGLRKYAQSGAPANPVVGDVWYKTDTDVYYQYINDGSANVWVDFVSATVANITAANAQYGTDVGFVSGTLSTTPQTGAVTVIGGVGITGNINLTGRVTAAQQVQVQNLVSNTSIAGATLNISGATTIGGNLSVGNIVGYGFSTNNGNVTATGLLTVGSIAQVPGNLSATGSYFSAGGLTSLNGNITGTGFNITNGNVITTGLRAVVGGLTIENGAFGNVASLGVIGSANIGGDVVITGNITGGGVRKYAQANTPAYPIAGDVWYKTDADIFYTYVNDGTNTYWIDYTSAAIANITVANAQYGTDVGFVSGTISTNQTNGAVTVIGGVGITGNINLTGRVTALDTVTGQAIVSNTSIAGATLSIAGDTAVGNLTAGNITAYGFSTNNGNVVATGKLTVGGLSVVPGNLSATGSYLSVNGFTALNGNITATGTTATIGGLIIANGGFGSIASLDVIGSATIGGNVTVTGNITGGGVRKTTGLTAPANPAVGDQWYKTDTDILYQFMNDGTNTYWVDFASATVANITNNFDGLGDFTTIGNVIGNGIVSNNYYYANGVSFVTTTVANTQNIVANITNGFNLGLDLTPTGATAGNYGSATSIPTVVVDNKGRITSITSNAVSTTFGLVGNVGTSSINGGNTLVIVGTPNQISTTVAGNTISIGFTPNISFTDFTVNGNLIYQGGGIKTTTSPTPPPGPVSGDMWYQSGTDILYRYIFDGTNEYWIDLFSTPLRAILPSQDIAGGDGEVQFNDNGTFGANANFAFDKTTGTLKVQRFRITQTQSPVTATSPGITGEITWDGGWMYVCVATNTWVRAGLYTW